MGNGKKKKGATGHARRSFLSYRNQQPADFCWLAQGSHGFRDASEQASTHWVVLTSGDQLSRDGFV